MSNFWCKCQFVPQFKSLKKYLFHRQVSWKLHLGRNLKSIYSPVTQKSVTIDSPNMVTCWRAQVYFLPQTRIIQSFHPKAALHMHMEHFKNTGHLTDDLRHFSAPKTQDQNERSFHSYLQKFNLFTNIDVFAVATLWKPKAI